MRRLMTVILPVGVLLAGVASAILLIVMRREAEREPIVYRPPLVNVITAELTNHQFIVSSQGTVQPRRDIQLVAEVAGRVVEVAPSLAAGGFFEKNEVLVKIDQRDYELALTRAQAQVRQAEVQLEREQAEADVARAEWDKLGEGPASALLLRKPQLAEAQAAVEAAQAVLEQAKLDLERCEVRAPFVGRVWEKRIDAGQYVVRGTVLARLYSVDYAEVRLPLRLEELAFLGLPVDYRAGQGQPEPPAVSLEGMIGADPVCWPGRIVRMEGEIDPHTRMATLVAQVADPYHRHPSEKTNQTVLPVGLFVEASIFGRQVDNVFVFPRTVLHEDDTVLVVDAGSRLDVRPVDVLRADRDQVVIGSGLHAGEQLVNSILDLAVDGMEVRLEEENNEASAMSGGAGSQ